MVARPGNGLLVGDVEAAQAGIMDGSTKVDTAFDATFDVAALRDSVRP